MDWFTYFFTGWIITGVVFLIGSYEAYQEGKKLEYDWRDFLFFILLPTCWPALIIVVAMVILMG